MSQTADDEAHAICHEAGHAVIGLHFGFEIEKIGIDEGVPKAWPKLENPERSPGECFLLLAGGIAAEKLRYMDFDGQASGKDQAMITERGGGPIEQYLPEAMEILLRRKMVFESFLNELTSAYRVKSMTAKFEAKFGGRQSRSFQLLSRDDIKRIWKDNT